MWTIYGASEYLRRQDQDQDQDQDMILIHHGIGDREHLREQTKGEENKRRKEAKRKTIENKRKNTKTEDR